MDAAHRMRDDHRISAEPLVHNRPTISLMVVAGWSSGSGSSIVGDADPPTPVDQGVLLFLRLDGYGCPLGVAF